jgi:hypothetical protein
VIVLLTIFTARTPADLRSIGLASPRNQMMIRSVDIVRDPQHFVRGLHAFSVLR